MGTVSFNGLLIISVIAVAAPVLAASVKRVKLPSAVVEIVAGIIVGPSVLGWVKINQPVNVVALLGLAFLLFLAGLEIDLRATTPRQLRARPVFWSGCAGEQAPGRWPRPALRAGRRSASVRPRRAGQSPRPRWRATWPR